MTVVVFPERVFDVDIIIIYIFTLFLFYFITLKWTKHGMVFKEITSRFTHIRLSPDKSFCVLWLYQLKQDVAIFINSAVYPGFEVLLGDVIIL
jgi:hypothetical protein